MDFGRVTDDRLRELQGELPPECLLREPQRLEAFAADELKLPVLPELVVEAREARQVPPLLRWAARHRIPVTARGAGTGLSGGALPVHGGVLLSLARLDRILEIDPVNQTARVEPGVINAALQEAAARRGLFYPPDPSSWESSSLGGNIAHNAGGPRCVKYGVTRDWVMQLRVVLADGSEATLGPATRKGVVGYSLRDLVVGSEGTLAVVTQALLRLLPKPEATRTLLAFFPDLDAACAMVPAFSRAGITPSAIEFMDGEAIRIVRQELPGELPEACAGLLLLECDGREAAVEQDSLAIGEACLEGGALDVLVAEGGPRREKLWEVRRSLSRVTRRAFARKISEDIAVPLDRIGEYMRGARTIGREHDLLVLGYGHLGDGNIHVNVLATVDDSPTLQRMRACVDRLLALAVELGGTISGEHGVGVAKQPWIGLELPPTLLDLQKRIKQAWDPQGILNPGKIFDWQSDRARELFGAMREGEKSN